MISKLGVGILLTVATLFFATPTNASAATSNTAQINKYFKQLKKLPNGAAPASKVNNLVQKLTKLNPKKATTYYKTGLTKIATGPSAIGSANKIAVAVGKIVKKAGLPSSSVAQINKQLQALNLNYASNPKVTESAMLELNHSLIIA